MNDSIWVLTPLAGHAPPALPRPRVDLPPRRSLPDAEKGILWTSPAERAETHCMRDRR
jgi:hypothetical protein